MVININTNQKHKEIILRSKHDCLFHGSCNRNRVIPLVRMKNYIFDYH